MKNKLKIKSGIMLFVFLAVNIFALPVSAGNVAPDFECESYDTYFTAQTYGENSSVSVEDGRLCLVSDNTGSKGIKISKVTSKDTISSSNLNAIYFTIDTPAVNASFTAGLSAGSTSYPFFEIKNGALSAQGAEIAQLDQNSSFVIVQQNSSYELYLNEKNVFSGEIKALAEGKYNIYLYNLCSSENVKSVVYVEGYCTAGGSEYGFASSITDGETCIDFDKISLDFGMPLLKAPLVELLCDGEACDTDIRFCGSSINIKPKDGVSYDSSYVLNISKIITADGTERESEKISFKTFPKGYEPLQMDISADKEEYSIGEKAAVSYSARGTAGVKKIELYVNGEIWETAAEASGTIYITFNTSGSYDIKVRAYDSHNGITDSSVLSVNVPSSDVSLYITNPGEKISYDIYENIMVEALAYEDIKGIELYINGVLQSAAVDFDDGIYTFGGFDKFVGDNLIYVEAEDVSGNKVSTSKNVYVYQNIYTEIGNYDFDNRLTNSFANGSNYEMSQVEGVGDNDTLVHMVHRQEDNNASSLPYFIGSAGGLKGIYELSFDLYLNEGCSVNLVTRGTADADWPRNAVVNPSSLSVAEGLNRYLYPKNPAGPEKWMNVKYICDSVNNIFWLYVDGVCYTAEDGNGFYANLKEPTVNDVRVEFVIPKGKSLYLDNIVYGRITSYTEVSNVEVSDRFVNISFNNDLSADSLILYDEIVEDGKLTRVFAGIQNMEITHNCAPIEIVDGSFDKASNTISLTAAKPLISGEQYLINLDSDTKDSNNNSIGLPAAKYFSLSYNTIDVTSFEFIVNNGKVGFKANVCNTDYQSGDSVVAVMVQKDSNGAVTSLSSTPVCTMNETDEEYTLSLAPTFDCNSNVEVFFMNGWENCKILKNMTYTYPGRR